MDEKHQTKLRKEEAMIVATNLPEASGLTALKNSVLR
jgi:hypothetical protein